MPEHADILRYTPPKRLKLSFIIALCVAVLVIAAGMISRIYGNQKLAAATNAGAIPTVSIISPSSGGGNRSLVLPGNIRAFYEAPIFAQVSGYLKSWDADIGTHVKAGQLLAEVDTPDLDQQLVQAKADLATAVANQELSATTARRWNELLAKDAVSQQDADDKNGDLAAKTAVTAAARANVERLQALESFKRIVAPFDGVVTSRSTDIGALISVGTPGQTPLFTVDDEHKLRIYVNVPQNYSAEIKPGTSASFTVPEYPGQNFLATLASTADAINTNTGTLLIQFQVDNTKDMLRPGDYAQVHIALPANAQALSVPSSALMFNDAGMQVATVGPDNHVVLNTVAIGHDLGVTVELASGITKDDRIINNPPDSIRQGDLVNIAGASGTGSNNGATH
jgi:multidrug efflux system membrane fusion protein